MITLRKENRIIRVTENELEKYLTKGYEVVSVEQKQEAPHKPIEEVKEELKKEEPEIVTPKRTKRRK